MEVTFTVRAPRAEKHGEDVTIECDYMEEDPLQEDRLCLYDEDDELVNECHKDAVREVR